MTDRSNFLPSVRRNSKIHELVQKYSGGEDDNSKSAVHHTHTLYLRSRLNFPYFNYFYLVDGEDVLKSCRPWNYTDYLARVATFQNSSHWFAKSSRLSPLECARWGWSCSQKEKDTLSCLCCDTRLVHDIEGISCSLCLGGKDHHTSQYYND